MTATRPTRSRSRATRRRASARASSLRPRRRSTRAAPHAWTRTARRSTGDDTPVSSSFSAGTLLGTVDVAAGARILCTITNDRRTGRIRVVKDIVPVDGQLGDPGKFDLQVDGSTVRSDAGDGDGSTFVTKPTGSHSVGELGGTGTSLADYDASVACADADRRTGLDERIGPVVADARRRQGRDLHDHEHA